MKRAPIECATFVFKKQQIRFADAWKWQQAIMKEHIRKTDDRDVLLLLEHTPVYTLGRSASLEFVHDTIPKDVDVLRINRGGEVTHHCPGQLIGYPLLDLRRYRQDLRWYLTSLEDVLINVLAKFGIEGKRHPKHTGVWSGTAKLAAIGINCSNWYTMHGFALNVNPDLSGFSKIVPCGITDPGLEVGSMHYITPDVNIDAVREHLIREFQTVFKVNCAIQEDPKSPVLSDMISAASLPQM